MRLALYCAYIVLILCLLSVSCVTLAVMLFAWRQDVPVGEDDSSDADPGTGVEGSRERLSFSLLVPARHEEPVLATTLDRLAEIEYDRFEVLVIVGHDDPGTTAVAHAAEARHPMCVRVIVDDHAVKSKPRALNTALPYCRGEVIGIFDAEDEVDRGLLRLVDRRMRADGCAALQSGVQLMNFWSRWYAVRNVLEYYFWYRSKLYFQASKGFIPLGGNTVFVYRTVLEELGGWDGDCLAEDCDLGVRLSSRGYPISVVYDPYLVTREECPATIKAFVRQRTRWDQGYLQVLFKREWTRLRGPQRAFAIYTLCTPLIQAISGLLLPFAIITIPLLSVPAGLAMFSFAPMLVLVATVVVEHLALEDFGVVFGVQPRVRHHLWLAVTTFPYHAVLAFAAMRAIARHVRGHVAWEKTAHFGLHLSPAASSEAA